MSCYRHIHLPYNHLTEAGEKSNHRAHGGFQMRTFRGGGGNSHEDPVYLDTFFDFCDVMVENGARDLHQTMLDCHNAIHEQQITSFQNAKTYMKICSNVVKEAKSIAGRASKKPLLGMNFYLIGAMSQKKITDDDEDRPLTAEEKSQNKREEIVRQLGGTVMTKDKALRVMNGYSYTPHCYAVLKDDIELRKATAKDFGRSGHVVTKKGMICRYIAAGEFEFLSWNYIEDARKCLKTIDPYERQKLKDGSEKNKYVFDIDRRHIQKRRVKDLRPLFQSQRSGKQQSVSVISSIKHTAKISKITGSTHAAPIVHLVKQKLKQDFRQHLKDRIARLNAKKSPDTAE